MDESYYQALVEVYAASVYRFFRRGKGLDESSSEELTHRTFVSIWESRAMPRDESATKAWLLGVARNVCRAESRRAFREISRREQHAHSLVLPMPEDPETHVIHKRNLEMLMAILDELDEAKREVFYLRYMQEIPVVELAEMLDCPTETVRSRLRWARQQVRHLWLEKTGRAVA